MKHKTGLSIKVYNIVRRIPKGTVLTYRQVARRAGNPQSWRAVGNILNKNKDPKIPCHRVIRSDGKVGGYNRGQNQKTALLKKEGVVIKKEKIRTFRRFAPQEP